MSGIVTKIPSLGQHDFKTPRFTKAEFNWTRIVTLRLQQFDVIADVQDVTLTSVTLPTTTSPDAAAQGAGYVQANVQSIATLANELKADFNAAMALLQTQNAELVAAVAALNEILSAIRVTPVPT